MAIQALIACGEDSLAQNLAYKLGALGLRVVLAEQTHLASSLVTNETFELVVVDCELQGGLEFIELVRHQSTNRRMVVTALVSGAEEARRSNQFGADFILNKPLDSEMTRKALRAAHTMIIREARESIREPIRVPAALSIGDVPFEGVVVDVSESGLGLEVERDVSVGQQLQIEFSLPGSDRQVRCTGKVMRVEAGRVGIHFLYLSAASAEVVMGWLRAHSPRRVTTA
jgi:DNA-binding response OmpR family regulator